MQQPLIPAGGPDLRSADIISNLDQMFRNQGIGDNHNAGVFAECYARIGDLIAALVHEGRSRASCSTTPASCSTASARWAAATSSTGCAASPATRTYAATRSGSGRCGATRSSPRRPPAISCSTSRLATKFRGRLRLGALGRVRGFSPPEMHLPNHPDVAYEYVKALNECGYRWLMVQEHSVETLESHGLRERHLPHRLVAKNSSGEEASIIALIKTQGSDTKLVGQMQPFYEAQTLQRQTVGGISIPPIVTQIGDGENGGVMMNEFPSAFRQAAERHGNEGVVAANGTEYLETIEQAGVTPAMLPTCRPINQGVVFANIKTWGRAAADKALETVDGRSPRLRHGRGIVDQQHQLGPRLREPLDPDEQAEAPGSTRCSTTGPWTATAGPTATRCSICCRLRRAVSDIGDRESGPTTARRSAGGARRLSRTTLAEETADEIAPRESEGENSRPGLLFSFPRSAWECRLRRSAALGFLFQVSTESEVTIYQASNPGAAERRRRHSHAERGNEISKR